jgi:hypothetical protein
MCILLDDIEKRPEKAKQMLGITYDQYIQLVNQAEIRDRQQRAEAETQQTRINAEGGGRKAKLTVKAQVCLCLFYLRHFPIFEVLGLLFGVSKTTANDLFHYWLGILQDLLPASLLEQMEEYNTDIEPLKVILKDFELIVDSTEQPRQRPQGFGQQERFYSGKKKDHTFKNQIIVLPGGVDIIDVIVGARGPTSDISLLRQQQAKFAQGQPFEGDKAYINAENTTTPHKKPRNGELTPLQHWQNKLFSSQRIYVEHVIRLIKIFRIAKERFRLSSKVYEQVIRTVCGLVRLRIGMIILPT